MTKVAGERFSRRGTVLPVTWLGLSSLRISSSLIKTRPGLQSHTHLMQSENSMTQQANFGLLEAVGTERLPERIYPTHEDHIDTFMILK